MTEIDEKTKRIAQLNDELRGKIGTPLMALTKDQFMMTSGIASMDSSDVTTIMMKVNKFDQFTPDNDPYGEHDFGAFDHKDDKIFWKINYYDLNLEYHSPDAADPEQTTRVLTVMLALEY